VKIRAAEERNRRAAEEIKAQAKEAEEAKKFAAEIRRLAKEDPAKAAELAGIDYREWTARRIRGAKADPVAETRAELERFRAEQAQKEEAAKAARAAEEAQALELHWKQVETAFSSHVKASAEHEFLRAELEADPELVNATLREMGNARPDLTLPEAAALYEQHLQARFTRYAGTAKARTLITPPATAGSKPSTSTPEAENGTPSSDGNGAVTLTNGLAQERSTGPALSTPAPKSALRTQREADEERHRRALALIGG
jgi:hypothetical protein